MTALSDQHLQQYRPYLLRYALLQLRNQDLAEDVVQETLLAALAGRARFSGNSSPKTWLTGILKHKIIDVIRRKSREQPLAASDDGGDAETIDTLFKGDGHWQPMPATWGNPEHCSVQLHLLLCKGCSNFRAQLDFLRVAVRRYRDGSDAR